MTRSVYVPLGRFILNQSPLGTRYLRDSPIPTPPSFANSQEALDAGFSHARMTVYIGGVMTDVDSYSVQIRAGSMSTATLQLTLPVGDHIVANAEVIIEDGHNNLVGRRFWGRIPAWSKAFSLSGSTLTIKAVGWSSLLDYTDRFELTFEGPITLRAVFDALCSRRGIPSYRADAVLDDTGTDEVTLAENQYVNDGTLTLPATTSPRSWLNSAAEEFGYRVFDDTMGTVRLSRLSGAPSGDPVINFIEGTNLIDGGSSYDISDIVNYWDVRGQTYEDDIGRSIPIRAIPEAVPANDLIPVNEGVAYEQHSSSIIDTQRLAEIIRRRLEIDSSSPSTPVKWSTIAIPGLSPCDTVSITSETLGITENYWLTSIDVTHDDNGLEASYEGWKGGGEALPAGVDRIVLRIQTDPVHIGDEYVAWYAHPSPEGLEKSWDFTIPKRATAVNVIFRVHGSNSQFIGGENTDLTVSKFELWKLPIVDPEEDKAHSSGSLPVLDENYAQQYKYATDETKWSDGAIALKGFDEEQVDVRLKLISGNNSEATAGPQDDFEVKWVDVEIYGTVEPVVIPDES